MILCHYIEMKRKSLSFLAKWLGDERRKPLILRGARQVGKSTLVRLFAAQHGLDLLEVNLEKTILTLPTDGIDVNRLLREVEFAAKKNISSKALIFFDELQANSKIILYLRYLYEERPELPVICAGSLLEFVLEEHQFSMPVGRVQYHYLGPMTFSEFLQAKGENQIDDWIASATLKDHIDAAHRRALSLFEEYLFVGGMPEAVKTYVKTASMVQARKVHNEILLTYQDDFPKYSRNRQVTRLKNIFINIPNFVGKKIKYSEIDAEAKSKDVKLSLSMLANARIILPCYHSNASDLSLRTTLDERTYKVYFLDIGLMASALKIDWKYFDFKANSVFKGLFIEQFVAQHFASMIAEHDDSMPELFYWLRDKKKDNAEVDFLLEAQNRVVPVEVKCHQVGKMNSLALFLSGRKDKIGLNLNMAQLQKIESTKTVGGVTSTFELIQAPVYFASESLRLIGQAFGK